jgi:hypothetical protein
MPPKKMLTILSYQDKFTVDFGLRVTARNATTSVVKAASCPSFECWDRDADEDQLQDGRKRKEDYEHQALDERISKQQRSQAYGRAA